MKGQTINRQIVAWMLLVTVIPLLVMSFYYLNAYDQNYKKQTFEKIAQIADKKTYQIEQLINERIKLAQLAAHLPHTTEALLELTAKYTQRSDNIEEYLQLQKNYSEKLQYFLEQGYYDIVLVTPSRDIVLTIAQEGDMYTNLKQGPYASTELAKSVNDAFLLQEPALSRFSYYSPSKEPAAFISVPVIEERLVIGVIAFQVDINNILAIVNDNTGLGLTGESHIVTIADQQPLFLNYSVNNIQFPQAKPTKPFVFGMAMQKAMEGDVGYGVSVDRNQQEVLAMRRYLPDLHAGFVVKVDSDEALKDLNLFWMMSLAILLMIICLVIFIAYTLSESITRPIKKLITMSNAIGEGRHKKPLVPEGTLETFQLATSFNLMLKQIKHEKAMLEQRVEFRTLELSLKEQNLALTLDSIGDAVISTDMRGHVTRMNPIAEQLTGWTFSEAEDKNVKEIFHIVDSKTKKELENPIERVMKSGRIFHLSNHTTLISRQGIAYQIADTAAPIRDAINNIFGMVLVFNDVSENYRLRVAEKEMTSNIQQSEKRLRLYREQSLMAMIEWNMDRQVVAWNKAAEEALGFSKKEVEGRCFLDFLIPEKLKGQAAEIWKQIISETGGQVAVIENLTKDGRVISCEWHNTLLRDEAGSIIGVASQMLDISERLRIDAVLQTLAETRNQNAVNETIFQLIVRQLALSQGVRYALIAQINANNPAIVDTLAVWAGDGFIENFSYELKGTPCEDVTKQGACLYSDNVQALFPEDELLVEMEAVCYFGVLLTSIDGKPLGILAILDVKVNEKQPSTSKLLESLAVRAGTELERKQAEEKLQFAARIFAETHEGIMITDADALIIDVNPGFSQISGYSRDEAIGRNVGFLSSDKQSESFYTEMWATLKQQGFWKGELWNRSKSGELYAELLSISALLDDNNEVLNYVGLFTDITVAKKQQQFMEQMAHYDALTGLPNRTLFADRFSQAIARSKRDNSLLAVCFIDLDEFKPVNDSYGHEAGDDVLIKVAQRIKESLREQDTASRLGGDEFTLLLGGMHSIAQCEQAMARIHQAIAQPYHVNGEVIMIAASSGITIYPHDDSDPDTLIRHADSAMYQAKLAGRNRYQLFDAAYDQKVIERHEKLNEIEQAIVNSEFCLYYQPKVNMQTGKVYGAEALIRWLHPEKGLIAPLDFLPFIEGTELEIRVGNWVIDEALKQFDLWQLEGVDLKISVNISAHHLQWQGFFQQIKQALARHPEILPGQLQLEILESSVLSDVSVISKIIAQCRDELGISIALDDFGTGYSSLTHLRRIPADTIKIDQAFVRDMLVDESDCAIVEGVTALAKAFNRAVIAEGVETKDHGLKLLALACINAQGYGIARPMPAEKFVPWMQNYQPYVEWREYNDSE